MPEHWFPPYKNDNKACLLKWSWASVYLWPNESSTCHRNKNVTIEIKLKKNDKRIGKFENDNNAVKLK